MSHRNSVLSRIISFRSAFEVLAWRSEHDKERMLGNMCDKHLVDDMPGSCTCDDIPRLQKAVGLRGFDPVNLMT